MKSGSPICHSSLRKTPRNKLQPKDYISLTRNLVEGAQHKPSQVRLRRAVSTAYYALFHTLASNAANTLIGSTKANRSKHAWVEVYRSVMHGDAKNACMNRQTVNKFPQQVIDFADVFVEMQNSRHEADYNPYAKFTKSEVSADIDRCEIVIADFQNAPVKDRTAFASWILFRRTRKG